MTPLRPASIFERVQPKGDPWRARTRSTTTGTSRTTSPSTWHGASSADLPERVYETLISLTPEEIEVLERVGASLNECEPHKYTYVIH